MTETNVFELTQPGTFSDPLTEVLRNGARTLLGQAIEAEVATWLSTHTDKLTNDGRRRLVRHGHLPEREIMTGIGAVAVRCPRVRDRVGEGGERIRFSSAILPPYARRSKSLEVLIPILYLKGISTGDFEEALIALLGKDAGGLSASTIGRLKEAWSDEHTRWSKRDLSAKRYVYFWVDGIHVQARLEEAAQCLLVIIGATPEGKKELVGLIDGVRESAQSWKELLLDLKRRGLAMGPELAVADGALGFWQAVEEVWPRTRGQRCWVHKTANVLNKLPKSQQSKAKRALQEIWMAETKQDALAAFGQSSTAAQPCDRPLDDPALGQGHEAFRLIAAFDDLGLYTRQNGGERVGKDRPLIRAVGEQFFEKGKAAEQRRKQQDAAVAILNVGAMNDGAHQQALRD